MQVGLRAESPNREFLQHEAKAIVQRNIDGLYSIGGNEREALEKLIDSIPTILGWLHQFCRPLVCANLPVFLSCMTRLR
jgi:hypothetical protein